MLPDCLATLETTRLQIFPPNTECWQPIATESAAIGAAGAFLMAWRAKSLHFQIDLILRAVLVFVNLQAAFLSPPVAISAFYLEGVSPAHVTINPI